MTITFTSGSRQARGMGFLQQATTVVSAGRHPETSMGESPSQEAFDSSDREPMGRDADICVFYFFISSFLPLLFLCVHPAKCRGETLAENTLKIGGRHGKQ